MQRERVRRLCTAAVCAALIVAVAAPSRAGQKAPESARDAVVAEVRRDLAESSEAMVKAAADLLRAQDLLAKAQEAAADARKRLSDARALQIQTAQDRRSAQTRLMSATQQAEASARRLGEQRAKLGRVARAAYQQGGAIGNVTILFEAHSPSDFTERLVALDQVVTSQRHVIANLETAQRKTVGLTHDFEELRDEVAATHERAQIEADAIEDLVDKTAAAEQEVARLVLVQRKALAAAAAARAEDERRLLELKGESDRLTSMLALQVQALVATGGISNGNGAGHDHKSQPGVLRWPVVAPVTSPFGMRVHPVTGVHKLHTGADFGAACGTPIAAARGGSVIAAGFNRAYGWRTVISHGVVGGVLLTTTYNHQTSLGVKVGQEVGAGALIGAVGTTGYSTGCHLHFELIINSEVVDPMPWLAAS